jgi:pyrimidine operon attenuation protein/uracil phosphoribosyltransferase
MTERIGEAAEAVQYDRPKGAARHDRPRARDDRSPAGDERPQPAMTEPASRASRTLYDATELDAVLDAMALACLPLVASRERVTVVGVLRRGVPLAQRLLERLARLRPARPAPALLHLKIQRYADDLTLLHPDTLLTEDPAHAALDLAGHTVLLVDDVLYRGHSLMRAVQWLSARRPAEVRVAVLADRHVAQLPVRADVVGLHLSMAPDDVVECHVPPYESDFSIVLARPERG